jgi:D-beta-D-heptose 7-phosphate kinase/D-beta-D-heptose 1-phosphate adenosyltransferase
MGSLLIVGLNSDSSVRAIKGADRPIHNENTRSAVLASIEYVDYLVLFSEDTPLSIIKLIKPDILVKGGDYIEKDIVGFDFLTSYGGKIITVPLLDGYSTTKLIDKSRRNS